MEFIGVKKKGKKNKTKQNKKRQKEKKEKARHRIQTQHHRIHATSPYHYTTKNDYEFFANSLIHAAQMFLYNDFPLILKLLVQIASIFSAKYFCCRNASPNALSLTAF